MENKQDQNSSQKENNAKLVVWFAGTTETKEQVKENIENLGKEHPNAKVIVIDGVATEANRKQANQMYMQPGIENLASNSLRKLGNALGNPVGKIAEFAGGYKEAAHLVQQAKTVEEVGNYLKENKDQKVDLIVGGFSRGAAVGLPAFLGHLAESTQNKEQESSLHTHQISSLSVIAVDPVPGALEKNKLQRDTQDYFGIETANKENPLKEVFEKIENNLEIPIDVTLMPARFDPLKSLEAGKNWQALVNDPPENEKININPVMSAGLNHTSMSSTKNNELYDKPEGQSKEASPNNLLNTVIGEKMGLQNGGLTSKEIYQEVRKKDNEIISKIATDTASKSQKQAASVKTHVNIPGASNLAHHVLKETEKLRPSLEDHFKKGVQPNDLKLNGRQLAPQELNLQIGKDGKLELLPSTTQPQLNTENGLHKMSVPSNRREKPTRNTSKKDIKNSKKTRGIKM